jgi:gluconokinase
VTRVLALDIGTSSVRALVFESDGTAVADAEARTRYGPVRGHQLDPDELVAASAAAIEEARREAGGVDAVAACSFMHSLLGLDSRGRPVTPVLTWLDLRAADEAEQLKGELDAKAVHARTGCPLHASFWPAKLRWLRRHEPDAFRSAARFVSFPDFLYSRLAGDGATSLSIASATGLLDVVDGGWDAELLHAAGVQPEQLPEQSEEPAGGPEPWFRALADGPCSNVGCGALGRERAALTVGTSAAFRVVFEEDHAAPRDGLFLYRLDGRRYVEGGALSDGGNLWAWLEQTLEEIDEQALADAPPDGHGLTFLTLLGGERSPGWHSRARGAVLGLSFETGPQQLAQAALEGVAFRMAEIADRMPDVRDVVAGGGALHASPAWTQILADVLERPLALSAVPEASARGAAVIALERLGASPAPPPIARLYEPRSERAEAYRAARERQRRLYAYVTEDFAAVRH